MSKCLEGRADSRAQGSGPQGPRGPSDEALLPLIGERADYQRCVSGTHEEAGRMPMKADDETTTALTADQVLALCGDILDWKVAAIIATGASTRELEEAIAWAAGENDLLLEERRTLAGTPALVYDILASDEDYPGGDDRA